jgi:hypothetical protein
MVFLYFCQRLRKTPAFRHGDIRQCASLSHTASQRGVSQSQTRSFNGVFGY